MMKYSRFIAFLAPFFLAATSFAQTAVPSGTTAQAAESVYVIVQLKSLDPALDSIARQKTMKSFADQVKQLNIALGYKEMEKKIASFQLEENGLIIPYLTVRPFTDMTDAADYAAKLKLQMPVGLYGQIKSPFPVTSSVYKKCMELGNFMAYYQSLQQGKG